MVIWNDPTPYGVNAYKFRFGNLFEISLNREYLILQCFKATALRLAYLTDFFYHIPTSKGNEQHE